MSTGVFRSVEDETDEGDMKKLLCPEHHDPPSLKFFRENEGLFVRYVCRNSHVVLYIPETNARKAIDGITADFEICAYDGVYRVYAIIESTDKQQSADDNDPFLMSSPNTKFEIVRANRCNSGRRRMKIGSRQLDIGGKSQSMIEEKPLPSRTSLGTLRPTSGLKRQIPRSPADNAPRKSARGRDGKMLSTTPPDVHSTFYQLQHRSGSKTVFSYDVFVIGTIIYGTENKVHKDDEFIGTVQKTFRSELAAAYGFSGIAIVMIKFVDTIPPELKMN